MSDFNHALNLTHDGTLILRIPKGYKVDKVVVEEMGTDDRVEYQPTHPTPSNTLGALDCVDRAEVIKAVKFYETFCDPYPRVVEALEELPSVQPEDWMEKNKERILQAGMEGQEIEFRIGGRLFAIREKAQ